MPTIEVAWAAADEQVLVRLEVADGTTLIEAVRQAGLPERLGWPADAAPTLGVHGQVRPESDVVREGDRVEIYRPLAADPKVSRRERVQRTRAARGGRPVR